MFEKLSARVSALFAKKPKVLVDLATYQKGYQRTVWYTAGTDLERNIFDQCFEQDVDCLDIDEAGQVSRDALVSIVGTAMNIALDSQIRKNMETTGAMMFNLPSPMVAKAIAADSKTPRRGLPAAPYPLANNSRKGKIRSPERDCKILGAPRKDAMAEDRVAAITPARMRNSTTATRFMDPYSLIKVSDGSVAAKTIVAKK